MPAPVLALDFGTSNSAVAVLEGSALRRLAVEEAQDTLPTAVFLPADGGAMLIGRAAEAALIGGDEGRYMRALKSVLGTPLFHDPRLIAGRRRTLHQVVTAFLSEVRARAEAQAGVRFTRLMCGRPVRFHSEDADRDARAAADLLACCQAAGFQDIAFLAEPEAAALATRDDAAGTRLIVDIGGGTSDFSVVRPAGDGVDVLASHGIRLGGTDFDQLLSMAQAMPMLGLGGQLRRTLGDGLLPVPRGIYGDLSTWALIPFLYTADTARMVADLQRHAVDPQAMRRLARVIGDRLGHEVAFAVEAGKIAANAGAAGACIDLGVVEPGLAVTVDAPALDAALGACRDRLRRAVQETLAAAGTAPEQVQAVVLVGGSSLMNIVEDAARAECPGAQVVRSNAFTAVVDGLALATAQRP